MAIKYTWKIKEINIAPELEVDGIDMINVVRSVVYEYTGQKGSGDSKKTFTYPNISYLPTPDNDNFISLHDLKESDVREWLKSIEPIDSMKEIIIKNIEEQEKPTHVPTALPWDK
tara:strand:- start:1930 stop:2274 length:345 start_codon:yes stop_codon:yes gene_type:complete